MKILITGGAGFIGSHIADAYSLAGHEVACLDNMSSGKESNLPKGAKLIKDDIRSANAQNIIITEAPDIIIHTAAQLSVRISMEDPVMDADVNVCGTVNLLQGARILNEKTGKKPFFVFLSTGGAIYGEQVTFPADENHQLSPESVYGLAKRVGELYFDLWLRKFEIPHVALRLSNVYGPRQSPHGEAGVVAIFIEKLLKGEIPTINGDGSQTRDFVYVKDVANAALISGSKNIQGIFNIGTGIETSVVELTKQITRALDYTGKINHGPAKDGEQQRSCISPQKALEFLNWKPTVELSQGIKETVEFFKGK